MSGCVDVALVEGKRTLISASLAPVVHAIASDPERRHRVAEALTEPARRLLGLVEDGRTVRSDDSGQPGKVGRKARTELEAALLARSTSVHTLAGHHVSLLEAYGNEPEPGTPMTHGLRALFEVSLRAAVVAERTEALKWFRFVEPDRERRAAALSDLRPSELKSAGHIWLTLDAADGGSLAG